jgi:hypothetical protein
MESKFKLPTETITLPSKGLLYPKENPLSSGEIEMSYMTAKHEDILTNANYIKNGTAIDKLLEALVVTPIDFNDLIIGDKNAILIAARILGYGKDYPIQFYNESTRKQEEYTVNLTSLKEKEVDESLFTSGKNEFIYELPQSKNNITFKLLTGSDEKKIDQELKGLKKLYPNDSFELTTRLKFMITSVEGTRETKDIREFVDKYLTAQDSRALRDYYNQIMPDVNMKIDIDQDGYTQEGVTVPIGLNFFWPDAGV